MTLSRGTSRAERAAVPPAYVISTSALASRDDPSGSDVHPQLYAAWPTERRTAEERALQQVLFVEDVFDVDLGPKDRSAHRERVPGARVQNETGWHFDRLVEVQEAGPVRRVGVRAVRESTSIGTGRGEVEAAGRIHDARDPRQTLVVVEIERSRRRHDGEESTSDRSVPIRMVQGEVHEIGRASCRERVCGWVVGGVVK